MEIIKILCHILQIAAASGIIILVLLQQGKGAEASATFGSSGGSGSLFGAEGSANFLSKSTAICAIIFFITTIALVVLSSNNKLHADAGVMSDFKSNVSTTKEQAPIVDSKHIKTPQNNNIPD